MAKHRKIKHYGHSFRARQRRRRGVLRFLLFLLVLAVLVFLGYSIAQSLGRLTNEPDLSSLQSQEDSSLPSAGPESTQPEESSSEPESTPEESDASVRAILMPLETLLSPEQRTAFLAGVDQTLYNTVALPLKDQSGRIYYQTGLDLAASCGALTDNALDAAELVREIEAYELSAAAVIYSLQDDYASHASYQTSYMYQNQSSVTWLDNSADQGGKSWLNPYMPNTQAYLSGMAAELAEAGFAEIFVFGNQYPTTANQRGMGLGDQGGVSQVDALENILIQMQQSAGNCRVIPAYLADCYVEGTRSQIYTVSPNAFSVAPSSPIIGSDPSLLEAVTASPDSLIPVIADSALVEELQARGIEQYLLQ